MENLNHFCPRKLHVSVPIVWGLTMWQLLGMMGLFFIGAIVALILPEGTLTMIVWGIVALSIGVLKIYFMVNLNAKRSSVKHLFMYLFNKKPKKYSGGSLKGE